VAPLRRCCLSGRDLLFSDQSVWPITGWVEKTPEHIFYIDRILTVFAEAKLVHMVRDGGLVAASIVTMWSLYTADWPEWRLVLMTINDLIHTLRVLREYGGAHLSLPIPALIRYRRYVRAVGLWNDSLVETRRYKGHRQSFICHYEELTTQPEKVLRSLCSFLEIEYNHTMLQPQARAAELIRPDEPWKERNTTELRPPSRAKYQQLPTEIKHVLDTLLIGAGNARQALDQ
jgi:hypothetical protein